MATVTLQDSDPQRMIQRKFGTDSMVNVSVVRLTCDGCGWDDKTFLSGCWHFAVDHLVAKHGGNGKLTYKGQYRTVENGYLQPETHSLQ